VVQRALALLTSSIRSSAEEGELMRLLAGLAL